MTKVWIVACTLLLVSVAGLAHTPPPLTAEALDAILGQPNGSCNPRQTPPPQSQMVLAANHPVRGLAKALCSASASCGTSTISCQGNNSTTSCTATDRNCSVGQRGFVTCDGVTTYCTTCPIDWCKECSATGDCFACCRCNNGTGCLRQCNPIEP